MWLKDINAQPTFPDGAGLLPPALLSRCLEARLQPQYRPVVPSLLQQQVLAVASGLGLNPQVEALSGDMLMDVDMVLLLPECLGDSTGSSSSTTGSSSSSGSSDNSKYMGLGTMGTGGGTAAGPAAAAGDGLRRVALQVDGPDHYCRDR